MAWRRALGILLLAAGASPADQGEPVPRLVVALVSGDRPEPQTEDIVHEAVELPLNHLGMVVLRHPIGAGPPPAGCLDGARAVLTFLDGGGPAPAWVWPWLEGEVRPRGLRVIHMGDLAPLEEPDPLRLARWLRPFGLEFEPYFVAGPHGIDVELADERASCFEGDPRFHANHSGPRSVDPHNRVWVRTRARAEPDDVRTPVVTGAWGGVALDPWALRKGTLDQDRRWYLDPFRFLREALGLEGVPAPHPSVLNGRRMWFLQIDGDGFESLSTVRPNTLAAQVMLDEVLLRYPLPYTVSIIVAGLTHDYAVEKPTPRMELARRILNLPHVEPASHGVLHTLVWQEDQVARGEARALMSYLRLANYEYGPVAEVRDSIRFINERLLEPPRRCAVMLWTGSADPKEDAIRAAVDAGCWNVNGGVFRWDAWNDSMGFVSPWSRRAGAMLQVYAGAANENDFDGFFDTMPGAFGHITTTIGRTGSPRVLKPANVYIHFYSAESPARLKSVHDLIRRWALEEPTAPVHASTYAKAVHSAVFGARVLRVGQGWALRGFGDCRTARIDGEPRGVDFARSKGLLGARRVAESLYLHLAGPDADVVLAARPPLLPHVAEANCLLGDARLEETGVAVTATAWNPRLVRFAGFPPRALLRVRLDGVEQTETADPQGELTVRLPDPGTTRVEVGLR